MLPKDRSATKSSKSATSSRTPAAPPSGPDTPVQFVKGVGPKLGIVFQSRGITTVRDLLTFFPRTYEDRTQLAQVAEVKEGQKATLPLEVVSSRKISLRTGKRMLEVRCTDGSQTVTLKWFHMPWGMENRFTAGARIVATGQVKLYQGVPQITHPEVTFGAQIPLRSGGPAESSNAEAPEAEASADFGRIIPIYVEMDGIPTRTLRRVLWNAVERYAREMQEDLPTDAIAKHGLPSLPQAIHDIHFPAEGASLTELQEARSPAHLRFIYEEFFKFEFLILLKRLRMEKLRAPILGSPSGRAALAELVRLLPFQLTGDQNKALEEVTTDLSQSHPMNRLIQGDVGSGKTAVALLMAGMVLAEGGQAALMAPTEILAEQHLKNAVKLFGGRLRVEILTGRTPKSERDRFLSRLEAGEPILLIGTHALIEDPVVFANLQLVMIDEQHRFGVDQRRRLRDKGRRTNEQGQPEFPHVLVLTATPIPRTLALTAYGDLAASTIREMPPGRMPIRTQVVRGETEKARAYEFVRAQIRGGRQAYFIYPLVNESEAEGFTHLGSATAEAEKLARETFPEFSVGLLHGQQKSDDKAETMARFSRGEIQVLVSTTVIEVGVDVANATVICIENAERFGLSQLHQLRGRVGRGTHASHCFLFSGERTGESSKARLDVLEQTTDGFEIAEADLQIRGPGEFLGVRQAGSLPFRMASLTRDQDWLRRARDDAANLLKNDAALEMPENQPLRRYFLREGRIQGDRLTTS